MCFTYIRKTLNPNFTQIIQDMIDAREPIAAAYFTGIYINVTHPEDIAKAEELLNGFHTS